MTIITDANLAILSSTLPAGSRYTGSYPNDGDTATITYTTSEGLDESLIINKLDIGLLARVNTVSVKLPTDGTVGDVYALFSDRLGLGLVPGTDYNPVTSPVSFGNSQTTRVTVAIDSNAILYKGSVEVLVVCDTVEDTPVTLDLTSKLKMVDNNTRLLGYRFKGFTTKVFNLNRLTAEAINVIRTTLLDVQGFATEVIDSIAAGEIVAYTFDGKGLVDVSVKTTAGALVGLSFELTDLEDLPRLD